MPLEEHIREGLKKSFKERRGRLEIIADILFSPPPQTTIQQSSVIPPLC